MTSYDAEREAVAHLFHDPLLASKNQRQTFWDGYDLDPVELMASARAWSTSERVLATVACDLWGYWFDDDEDRLYLRLACDQLDNSSMRLVLEALAIRAAVMPPGARLSVVAALTAGAG